MSAKGRNLPVFQWVIGFNSALARKDSYLTWVHASCLLSYCAISLFFQVLGFRSWILSCYSCIVVEPSEVILYTHNSFSPSQHLLKCSKTNNASLPKNIISHPLLIIPGKARLWGLMLKRMVPYLVFSRQIYIFALLDSSSYYRHCILILSYKVKYKAWAGR